MLDREGLDVYAADVELGIIIDNLPCKGGATSSAMEAILGGCLSLGAAPE